MGYARETGLEMLCQHRVGNSGSFNAWCPLKGHKYLKLVSAILYQIFIFDQMIGLQKLWKKFFISSKNLFSFSRYSIFCNFFPSFPTLSKFKMANASGIIYVS